MPKEEDIKYSKETLRIQILDSKNNGIKGAKITLLAMGSTQGKKIPLQGETDSKGEIITDLKEHLQDINRFEITIQHQDYYLYPINRSRKICRSYEYGHLCEEFFTKIPIFYFDGEMLSLSSCPDPMQKYQLKKENSENSNAKDKQEYFINLKEYSNSKEQESFTIYQDDSCSNPSDYILHLQTDFNFNSNSKEQNKNKHLCFFDKEALRKFKKEIKSIIETDGKKNQNKNDKKYIHKFIIDSNTPDLIQKALDIINKFEKREGEGVFFSENLPEFLEIKTKIEEIKNEINVNELERKELEDKYDELEQKHDELENKRKELKQKRDELENKRKELEQKRDELEFVKNQFSKENIISLLKERIKNLVDEGYHSTKAKLPTIENPTKSYYPNQGPTSLCGPAVFFYCLLVDRPDLYVKCVIDLWEKGETQIKQLKIKPGKDCKNPKSLKSGKYSINGVDWITLAGLRDSSNFILDYDEVSDEMAGITLAGRLKQWFLRVNARLVFSNVTYGLHIGKDKLLRLIGYKTQNSKTHIISLINAEIIGGHSSGIPGIKKSHWVVWNTPPQENSNAIVNANTSDSALITQSFVSWGENNRQLPNGVSLEKYLTYQFGSIVFLHIPYELGECE